MIKSALQRELVLQEIQNRSNKYKKGTYKVYLSSNCDDACSHSNNFYACLWRLYFEIGEALLSEDSYLDGDYIIDEITKAGNYIGELVDLNEYMYLFYLYSLIKDGRADMKDFYERFLTSNNTDAKEAAKYYKTLDGISYPESDILQVFNGTIEYLNYLIHEQNNHSELSIEETDIICDYFSFIIRNYLCFGTRAMYLSPLNGQDFNSFTNNKGIKYSSNLLPHHVGDTKLIKYNKDSVISVDSGSIIANTWSARKESKWLIAFSNPEIKFESNERLDHIWYPRIDLLHAYSDNHRIATASIHKDKLKIVPTQIYDMDKAFELIRTDCINWLSVENKIISPVADYRIALLFEIERIRAEKHKKPDTN